MTTDIATVPSSRLLHSKSEFDAAHAELLALLDAHPEPGTAEHDRLEYLTVLIEAYDRAHSTLGDETPTPQSLVEFALEQRGMTRTDLAELMGGKSRVSEFFSGARPLSTSQVKALRAALEIPADLLIPHDDLLARAHVAERRALQATRQVRALTNALALSTGESRSSVDKVRQLLTGQMSRGPRVAKAGPRLSKVAAKAANKRTAKRTAKSVPDGAEQPSARKRSSRS